MIDRTRIVRRRAALAATSMLVLMCLTAISALGVNESTAASDRAVPIAHASTAFTHVNVLPMDTERVLRDQTVIVHGDQIIAMGKAGKVNVPQDATVIDGTGKWLMPGLCDMHTHTWDAATFPLFLANGVTTIRNLWGTELQLTWQREIAAGTRIDAPNIYTAGPIVDGTPPIWQGSIGVDDPDEAREIVRQQKQAGYQFIKVYSKLQPDVFNAIVETANEEQIPVIGHVPVAVGLMGVLESGQQCIEHLTGYLDACQKGEESAEGSFANPNRATANFDETKLSGVVDATVKAGVWNCPTLVVMDRISRLGDFDAMATEPIMRYVAPSMIELWRPQNDFRFQNADDSRYEGMRRKHMIERRIAGDLNKAGAKLLLGTDTGNPFVVPGFSVHEELDLLVKVGLTPFQALQAGTRNPAIHLRNADSTGLVAKGMQADLVLLNANPLDEVSNARDIAGVMVRGNWFDARTLQSKIDALAETYAAQANAANADDAEKADPDAGPNRFANFDPLPQQGRRVASGRYTIGNDAMTFGEERFALQQLRDGSQLFTSQATYMPFSDVYTNTAWLGVDGAVERMRLQLPDGSLDVTRDKTNCFVRGELNGEKIVQTHEIVESTALHGQSFTMEWLAARQYARESAGDTTDVDRILISYFPQFSVQRQRSDVKYIGSKDGHAHVFEFVGEANDAPSFIVRIDASGMFSGAEAVNASGTMLIKRAN